MNTHDIELPDPKYPGTKADIPNAIPDLYTADQLRATIEADRKRRGEPVGYLVELDGRDTYVSADRTVRDAHLTYGWRPVYAAPQLAKPCASSVSDKTTCGSANGDCDSQPAEPVKKKDWNVELSSWSDEDFVQVFHERPDLANRLRRVLAEPVKCPDPSMGEHACSNRAQCWEPCGELGSSIEHAKVAQPVKVPSVPEPLKYGREWKDHYVTGWNNCRAAMLAAEQAQQDDLTPEEEKAWQQMEKTND